MNRLPRHLGIKCIIKVLKLVNAKIILSKSKGAITPLILALYTGLNLQSVSHSATEFEACNTDVKYQNKDLSTRIALLSLYIETTAELL